MSWNLNYPADIKSKPASEAKEMVTKTHAPQSIKDYINAGIDGLGADAVVTVTGHGHLCDGPQSYSVTSAVIEVKRG